MAFKARDYQDEDVEKIFSEWGNGVKSTLYVAATGLGKTSVMAMVANRMRPGRTLMLCHRSELIAQARDTFELHGLECDIEKAELMAGTSLFTRAHCVLATVQTLNSGSADRKRMQRFKPTDFALLLYDECHHSPAKGNKSIVDYFVEGNPNLKVLGVTATPSRADEEALGQIFESVAAERNILWGIQNGWLVDIEQKFVNTELDWSHVSTNQGDLNQAELAAIMESEEAVQSVVQPTLESLFRLEEHALDKIPVPDWGNYLRSLDVSRRRAIVFTISVAQAELLCGVFNRVIDRLSTWVCGKTSDDKRLEAFSNFKSGAADILVNVGVATEGFDCAFCDMIVQARPTKSHTVYVQQVGRGTRVLPGLVEHFDTKEERIAAIAWSAKPSVLVIDLVGNSGKHVLMTTADLLGGNVSEEAVERVLKKAKEDGRPVRIMEALDEEEKKLVIERERRRLAEEARKRGIVARTRYASTVINPFEVFSLNPERARSWDNGKRLSEKQLALLQRQGINPDNMTYGQSRQVLNELFRRWSGKLATLKQAAVIRKHYPEIEIKTLTMTKATELINLLAANHWKRPEKVEAAP